jgi:hypothetical protein
MLALIQMAHIIHLWNIQRFLARPRKTANIAFTTKQTVMQRLQSKKSNLK